MAVSRAKELGVRAVALPSAGNAGSAAAAYAAAAKHTGAPTVIFAHTKKGYGMGSAGQGRMTTHSQKKLDEAALLEFRNRFNLPLSDEQAKSLEFFKPGADKHQTRIHGCGSDGQADW